MEQDLTEPMLVARQPIFTAAMKLFAYELLIRTGEETGGLSPLDSNNATIDMITDGFAVASKGFGRHTKLAVNASIPILKEKLLYALPANRTIIQISSDIAFDKEIIESCKALRRSGYTLALVDYSRPMANITQLDKVFDLVRIDVKGQEGRVVAKTLASLKGLHFKWIARQVGDWEMFSGCKFLGFHYFQGTFFSKPEFVPGRKIHTQQLVKMRLIKELSQEHADIGKLSKIIALDPSLSLRLLKFVNSVSFCLTEKVDSLARAISIVGIEPLKRWAYALLLSDVDRSPKGHELMFVLLNKAIFLSLLHQYKLVTEATPDKLFLLGLFSGLDALFGLPMAEILTDIPLEEEIKAALLGDEMSPLYKLLRLAKCMLEDRWIAAAALLPFLRIPPKDAASIYIKSTDMTYEAYHAMG